MFCFLAAWRSPVSSKISLISANLPTQTPSGKPLCTLQTILSIQMEWKAPSSPRAQHPNSPWSCQLCWGTQMGLGWSWGTSSDAWAQTRSSHICSEHKCPFRDSPGGMGETGPRAALVSCVKCRTSLSTCRVRALLATKHAQNHPETLTARYYK